MRSVRGKCQYFICMGFESSGTMESLWFDSDEEAIKFVKSHEFLYLMTKSIIREHDYQCIWIK